MNNHKPKKISRRDFIKASGLATLGLFASSCNSKIRFPTEEIFPTLTSTPKPSLTPNPTQTEIKPTKTKVKPTETEVKVSIESLIEESKSFPGIVGVEERNGEYRAVDEKGLSRFILREENWVEIPKIKPSDITEDDRMYYEPVKHISREPFPYGAKKTREDLYPGYPDIENWTISGVLLEEPFVRSEGTQQLVFKVGFPVGDDFAVLNLIDTYGLKPPDLVGTYLFLEAPKGDPGFNSYMVSGETWPLPEAIEKLKNAVGRQTYMEHRISDSEESLIKYYDDYYKKLVPDNKEYIPPLYYSLEEIKKCLPETIEVFSNLKSGNFKAVEGKYFHSMKSRSVFPVTPKK